MESTTKKAYWWVPTLYFAEGLPYFIVMELSAYLYKDMGLSDTEMSFYTGMFYLPWVIKPLWSPLIDATKTKRWWIVITQFIGTVALFTLAISLHTTWWLAMSISLCWLMAFTSATHDIAADGFYILALDSHTQAFYVGVRSFAYRIARIFIMGGLLALAGWAEQGMPLGNNTHLLDDPSKQTAWSITLCIGAVVFLLVWLWHLRAIPHAEQKSTDTQSRTTGEILHETLQEMKRTFTVFFSKPYIWTALLFIFLFRFPEAQLGKLSGPFMMAPLDAGGLELDKATISLVNSVVGVIGLLVGGILGGVLISRGGLKRWLWPMVCAISLPDALYILMAATQTQNIYMVGTCVFVEQFGYGFGYSAYMLYLVYFSTGEKSTSIFALCTAITSLGMMLPGMMAGWIADHIGYTNFFIYVTVCCAVTFLVSAFLKIDPEYGKKQAQ